MVCAALTPVAPGLSWGGKTRNLHMFEPGVNMDRARRSIVLMVSTVIALSSTWLGTARAQTADYPSHRLTFVVGFAPGGGIDTMARIVAQGLTEQFGYQIVVENRPG